MTLDEIAVTVRVEEFFVYIPRGLSEPFILPLLTGEAV